MQIRPFQPDDAPSVQFVVLSVLHEWGFMPTHQDQQELDNLQDENLFSAFYVAQDSELGVVGCAGIYRLDDTTCELRKMYLLQRFRSQGIGQQLFDACLKAAQSERFKRMRLEVHTGMVHFAKFYIGNGFTRCETEAPLHNPNAEGVFYKPIDALTS